MGHEQILDGARRARFDVFKEKSAVAIGWNVVGEPFAAVQPVRKTMSLPVTPKVDTSAPARTDPAPQTESAHEESSDINAAKGRPDPYKSRDLSALKQTWGFAAEAPLVVIGRLAEHRLVNSNAIFFLEQLEDPVTGRALTYPAERGEFSSAFVLASEARRLLDENRDLGRQPWAMGELELSPESERRKHRNPDECMVRRGTLRLLSEVPENWQIVVTGDIGARKIAASAREAIEDNIRGTLSAQIREYELQASRANTELAESKEELRKAEKRQGDMQQTLAELVDKTRLVRAEQADLKEEFQRERKLMEERMENLADLLKSKGGRLVALDLVDPKDLAELLPASDRTDERPGLGLDGSLGGDFASLAALVQARLWRRNMIFSKAQLQNFLALLRTSDFVILAGDSGSGKSSMVKAVAETIGARCTVIAVKPNWTGPEDLLGYYNPIEQRFQTTPFLQALLTAAREPDAPHFILLDEMNLARVEHYFADFLSLLETRDHNPDIPLFTNDEARHVVVENGLFLTVEAEARLRGGLPKESTIEDLLKDETANRYLHLLGGFQNAESVLLHHARLRRALAALVHVPTRLAFPPNVRIIGAINVDDTTYSLSPKVLDRVHVLRFGNPLLADWDALEAEIEPFDPNLLTTPLRLTTGDFGPRAEYPAFDRSNPAAAFLGRMARDHLDPLGLEFGLRAIRQSLGYLEAAKCAGINETTALNNIVLQKILPKITLDTERAAPDGRNRRDILIALRDELEKQLDREKLALGADDCVARLDRLIAWAEQNNGIANYWLR